MTGLIAANINNQQSMLISVDLFFFLETNKRKHNSERLLVSCVMTKNLDQAVSNEDVAMVSLWIARGEKPNERTLNWAASKGMATCWLKSMTSGQH